MPNFEADMDKITENVNKTVSSFLLMPVIMGNKLANMAAEPIKPVINQMEYFKNIIDEFNDKLRSDLTRILFTTRHKNIIEAAIADIVDVIPGLGNITEAERLADARRIGDRDAVVAHGIDTAVGEIFSVIPMFGEFIDSFLDALLPSNTLLYLKRRGLIEWNPPLPPLPSLSKSKRR